MKINQVCEARITHCNDKPINPSADYIIYWMIANRRLTWNFSLDHAINKCNELAKPLLIFEPLRCGYKWASDRIHAFIIQGMKENLKRCPGNSPKYLPYLESDHGNGKGLLKALSANACMVVTDDYPAFFLPRMVTAAASSVPVRMEMVDSNGLAPMSITQKTYSTAHGFRRFLQKELPNHILDAPNPDPFSGYQKHGKVKIDENILTKWGNHYDILKTADHDILRSLSIDHGVLPTETAGGASEAEKRLKSFVKNNLSMYSELSNHPDEAATSGLSPYLHFGHISTSQVFHEVAQKEDWRPDKLSSATNGKRIGWWGMSEAAETFLDQLITWRELGFNMCNNNSDYGQYDSLPQWAGDTLNDHRKDQREFLYSLQDFEQANTHEKVWNAAQNQLLQEGVIHNYMRMVWGKKILQWTQSPEEALDIMIHLNNKHGLDGRDPNSYSGIFWILGRYDRPWGPERPIFGKIRYMSEKNTIRKLRVRDYLEQYG